MRAFGDDIGLTFRAYDPLLYWYFSAQPDCPIDIRDHFGLSYQWTHSGMDFSTMSHAELVDAARKVVAQWRQQPPGRESD